MPHSLERWRQVDQLFQAALEQTPADRAAFLGRACEGQPGLRAEVEKMLAYEEQATELIDSAVVPQEIFRGGSDPIDEGRFLPGDRIADRYRVVGLVGHGGMGEVYRADDLKLRQRVALKFLPERLSTDAAALARFHQEVSVARQISHRYVCRVYDVAESCGQHFLSMEFIQGEDLGSLLKRIVRPPQSKALEMARQLCAGLAAIHEKGVLHRDLKPTNIMLDDAGQVRITDFGLAATANEVQGREAQAGTPGYMSPEQIAGGRLTVRSDIYSLGLVLHEVFTGKRPGTSRPSQIVPDLDPVVERAILRCLQTEPQKRPGSALEVAASLPGTDPLAAALASGETPSPEMVAAAPKQGSLRPAVAWALLLSTVAGLAATMVLSRGTELYRMVPLPKSTEVLEDRAREIAVRLGYSEAPRDALGAFQVDGDYVYRVLDRKLTWHPSAMRFWYRQSPRYLNPQNGFLVTPDDPPENVTGMISMQLSTTGELRNLSVVLPQKDTAGGAATQPAWIDAFREAGLNAAEFQASSSEWVPPMAYDARMAWTGPVRVEAAAYRGKLVYFEVVPAWRVPRRQAIVTGFPMQFWVLAPVFLSVLGVGGWAALRNLRAGRGDRRGALRLAVFVFGARMVAWAFSAHHIPGIDELTDLLLTGLESAAFWAASVGVVYLALEPMLRRHWPERLIGWSRLLAGEYRDPLVGRDVLVGTLFAAAALLVTEIANAAHRWLGLSPIGPHVFVGSAMIGIGGFLPYTMNAAITALVQSLLIVFVMFLPSLLLRQEWASRGVAFVVLCAMLLPSKTYRGTHYLPWEMVTVLLLMIAVLHFGALTGAVTLFVIHMQVFFPITTELTAWYARGFGLFLLLVAAIAAWGARASLAGRPLFGPRFLEE